MMIHAGLLGAARACEVPAAASGGTVGPPLSTSRGTPDDLQSCMLGPAVTLAAPAQAAAASAGSMLAGASTGDMQRRMGAAGVGAFDQRVVLAALGRAPDGRPAAPAPKDSTQQWQRAQHPQQQRVQQQAGSQVGSLGSRPPEEPASPEQRAQPTLPPSSSDDHAEVAPHHAQHPHAHPVAAAAAATPRRRDAPPGTAGKRRSATAGRKQTPGLAATVMAAAARPGTCSAAEASEQAVLQPNARPLQQHQQLLQQPQQPELSREQHQQGEALLEQPVLPPEPGPRPQQPQADTCRQISPQQWREYKAALRCWELRKRAREEAEEELTRPRRRRRPPSPDRRPQTMPPVAPGSAAALLRQQHEAFAALAAGRRGRGGGLRRAAAVRGAKRISAIAGGLLGGRRRGVGSSEEEEVEHPADMDSLRASAPHLIQLRSALHGWGMFAGEPIRRNSFVIEYVGEVVPNAVADRREARYEAEGLGSMYLFRLDRGRVVDATKAGNCARFINHSCEPNCYTAILVDIRSGERSIGIFAKCDIAQGEELTYHYMVEEEPDGEPMPCHCGARSCTGRMN